MDSRDWTLVGLSEPGRLHGALRSSVFAVAVLLAASHGTPATEGFGTPSAWPDASASTFTAETPDLAVFDRVRHEFDVAERLLSSGPKVLSDPTFQTYLSDVDSVLSRHPDGPQTVQEAAELAAGLASARAPLERDVTSLAAWCAVRRAVAPEGDVYKPVPRRFIAAAASVTRIAPPTGQELDDWLALQSQHDV